LLDSFALSLLDALPIFGSFQRFAACFPPRRPIVASAFRPALDWRVLRLDWVGSVIPWVTYARTLRAIVRRSRIGGMLGWRLSAPTAWGMLLAGSEALRGL